MLSAKTLRGRGRARALAGRAPGPPLHATLRELLMLLAAVGTLGLIGWATVLAVADALTRDPVKMPVPLASSRKIKLPLLINIAIDESGSMAQSDPDARRWTDVAALARWLGRYQRPGDQVAVTRFAGDAVHGPIVSAHRLGQDPRRLAPAPTIDGTAFLPVATTAEAIFAAPRQAYYKILILLTDGESGDAGAAVARLPGIANRVFVVALDKGSSWDSARKTWEHAGFPVTKLGNRAPNEIGAAMARAVMAATGETER
jgi:hypothetical protein